MNTDKKLDEQIRQEKERILRDVVELSLSVVERIIAQKDSRTA